jgi:hypothetical protein
MESFADFDVMPEKPSASGAQHPYPSLLAITMQTTTGLFSTA